MAKIPREVIDEYCANYTTASVDAVVKFLERAGEQAAILLQRMAHAVVEVSPGIFPEPFLSIEHVHGGTHALVLCWNLPYITARLAITDESYGVVISGCCRRSVSGRVLEFDCEQDVRCEHEETEPHAPKLTMLAHHLKTQHPVTATRFDDVFEALASDRLFVQAHTVGGDDMVRVSDAVRYHHACLDPFGDVGGALMMASESYSKGDAEQVQAEQRACTG